MAYADACYHHFWAGDTKYVGRIARRQGYVIIINNPGEYCSHHITSYHIDSPPICALVSPSAIHYIYTIWHKSTRCYTSNPNLYILCAELPDRDGARAGICSPPCTSAPKWSSTLAPIPTASVRVPVPVLARGPVPVSLPAPVPVRVSAPVPAPARAPASARAMSTPDSRAMEPDNPCSTPSEKVYPEEQESTEEAEVASLTAGSGGIIVHLSRSTKTTSPVRLTRTTVARRVA